MKKRGKVLFIVFIILALLVVPETVSMFLGGNYVTFLKDVSLICAFGLMGFLYLMSEGK